MIIYTYVHSKQASTLNYTVTMEILVSWCLANQSRICAASRQILYPSEQWTHWDI